ncbi:MAG: replication-associated recombination protein A [Alphaproteobacteria bacterium]|nr:replication-associated recombination protein A [Alphaproteobacteria bacterium]
MPSLFDQQVRRPLADLLRPQTIDDVVGQNHLLGENAPLGRMLKSGKITSFILWGPPGCGKTTIARLIAKHTNMYFEPLSAVFSGVSDLRKVFDTAKMRQETGRQTLLFVDEIHRFNRAQQDAFLPYVENGTIVLIGATTENPSFELNAALLSRAKVFVLKRLTEDALEEIILHAEKQMAKSLPITEASRDLIKSMADGDGRYLSNMIEALYDCTTDHLIDTDELMTVVSQRPAVYDKDRDGHYNLISAVHKSLRGSDPDAALYWVARMMTSGEDPKYIFRRLTRFAVEDIGLADPNALHQAVSAWEAYERLGSPEGDLALAQLTVYLATAPKSIGVYRAWNEVSKTAKETGSLMPPMNILNAPTKLMAELGYNKNYQYDPDCPDGFSGANYFPEKMGRRKFYTPIERGFEREICKRLAYWENLRNKKNGSEF